MNNNKSLKKYGKDYFLRYVQKNTLGQPRGERAFFYNYWMGYLSKIVNNGAKILEVGCGLGYFSKKLSSIYTTYSIDISPEALHYAKNYAENGIFVKADAEQIPFKKASIDCVIAFDLIEHLSSPEIFLEQVKRILKRDGFFILGTPNPESLGSRIKKKRYELEDVAWENRIFEWHGWRDETHINIRKIVEWETLVREIGFHVIRNGTDFLWDTPYFPHIPVFLQKLFFNGSHRLITSLFGFLPWKLGANYYLVAKNYVKSK